MKIRILPALAVVTAALSLSACDEGYGGSRVAVGWSSPYAWDTYYDGYYGPIYDGYWGRDNAFWYRSGDRGYYRRGDGAHFRRDLPNNDMRWGGRTWERRQGMINARPAGRMPHFPRDHR